jgi:hypothetical protein
MITGGEKTPASKMASLTAFKASSRVFMSLGRSDRVLHGQMRG